MAAKRVELIKQFQSYKPDIGYNSPINIFENQTRDKTGFRIGVDGCKAGWFYVATLGEEYEFGIVETLAQLFDTYDVIEEVIVDIPIGLFDCGASPRFCDTEARKLLSPRGSTVLPAPLRPCLSTSDYENACAVSKQLSGKSLSKQAYNIFNKINEVDDLLRSDNRYRCVIKEAHPELGFCFLNYGKPLLSKKKDLEGLRDRLDLLATRLPFARDVYSRVQSTYPRKQLAKDDIVDALMCLTISMATQNERVTVPETPETDTFGIEMVMHYAKRN